MKNTIYIYVNTFTTLKGDRRKKIKQFKKNTNHCKINDSEERLI